MKPIQRLFRPLRNAWQVFFARDLKLQRGDRGLEIVLAERNAPPRPRADSREQRALEQERRELALMQEQLAAVLDDVAGTRQTLRHLVFVEQALQRKGWRALHKLPLDVLRRALEQLEGLVTNWSPAGLANLRSKMAVAIIDREHMDPHAEADAYRTAMPMESTIPMGLDGLPAAAVVGEMPLPEANGDEAAALAAAYAALGVAPPAVAGSPSAGAGGGAAGAVAPQAAPTPAQLAAQALAQMKTGQLGGSGSGGNGGNVGSGSITGAESRTEPLEFHNELGSKAAKAQPRQTGVGKGKLPPLTLREVQG